MCAERLAPAVPGAFVAVDALPLTTMRKVHRKLLTSLIVAVASEASMPLLLPLVSIPSDFDRSALLDNHHLYTVLELDKSRSGIPCHSTTKKFAAFQRSVQRQAS